MSETYECLEFSKTHLSGVSNQRGSINIPLVVIVQVVALLKKFFLRANWQILIDRQFLVIN